MVSCADHTELRTRNLIVRYRQGTPVWIPPDLPEQLAAILVHLRSGHRVASLVQPFADGNGAGVHPDSTWPRLVDEVFQAVHEPEDGRETREQAVIAVIEAAGSTRDSGARWNAVRAAILDRVDTLSGWEHSVSRGLSARSQVTRSNGRYYMRVHGQLCEVTGARTEREARWDRIAADVTGPYGAIQGQLRLVALLGICEAFCRHPEDFPSSIRLMLSEVGGYASFLRWSWHIPWPYRPRRVPWRPASPHCDPAWLGADLLAALASREGVPADEIDPPPSAGPIVDFESKFAAFPKQAELVIDTPIHFSDEPEVWFEYHGMTLRWLNQTAHEHGAVIVPVKDGDEDAGYQLATRFLSALTFQEDLPIAVLAHVPGRRSLRPHLAISKHLGGINLSPLLSGARQPESTPRRHLALSFYREGLNSRSVYYEFLNYYKVLQLAFNEDSARIKTWINESVESLNYPGILERLTEIRRVHPDVARYLYTSGRCAIAHTSRAPFVDPDKGEDLLRLNRDLIIVKGLARLAIEKGLFG